MEATQTWITEVVYVHTVDDIDWRDVEAVSRAEAEAVAAMLVKRELWPTLRDVAIVSVTAEPSRTRKEMD